MRKDAYTMAVQSVITIGRQYGSGGRYVGRLLAERLGIPFYDKEILAEAARVSGMAEEVFESHDEKRARSFLYSLVTGVQGMADAGNMYMDMPLNHKVFLAQFDAIRSVAEKGPCVIVGRCSDYVLRDHAEATNVFITASMEWRIAQVSKRHECDEQTARKIIHNAESQRASYYNYYTGKRWGDAASYDLCIDTSILGIDDTHQLIADFIRKRLDKGRERQ